jgi:hypothetical protein
MRIIIKCDNIFYTSFQQHFGQPNAFASTFYFYLRTMQTHKKIKRACKQTHEGQSKLDTTALRPKRATSANSTYKKLAVQWLNQALCFVSSSVVADSFRLRNRQLLVAAKRYVQPLGLTIPEIG